MERRKVYQPSSRGMKKYKQSKVGIHGAERVHILCSTFGRRSSRTEQSDDVNKAWFLATHRSVSPADVCS